ncbi:YkgJ family cysteine cluster protein [Chromobacterium vaccinii]|nr:YkgJ family cysteine cluster protein [Chromobacterium vaccinii]
MDAFRAIPILESKVSDLEAQEESWKNCRACPHEGKCCDGATLIAFPEEIAAIREYIKNNLDVLQYAVSRYRKKKPCYFYDKESTKCLIHEVRPLNCRWTPYAAFPDGNGGIQVNIRSVRCDFKIATIPSAQIKNNMVSLPAHLSSIEVNNVYLNWQSLTEFYPLMARAKEMVALETLMMGLTI